MDQRSGDGRFGGWIKNPRHQLQVRISRILKCWMRELLLLWTRSSRIPTSKRRSVWRNRKLRNRIGFFSEDRSPTWFTTVVESLVLLIPFLIMLNYSQLLFAMMMFRTSIRDGMKFRKSVRIENRHDMEIHQKISMPNYQKLKTIVKRSIKQKLRLRNFDARNDKLETGSVVTSRRRLSGIEWGKGFCYQWKAEGQCSRGDQCCFRHESHDREKPTPKAAPSCEARTPRGRSASRKRSLRGRSHSGKSNRQPCKNFLTSTCTKLPCDHCPECQLYMSETGAECSFPHWKVEEQPNKKAEEGRWQTWSSYCERCTTVGLCIAGRRPPESVTISRRARSVGTKNRRVRFTRAALRQANIRDNKGPSLGKNQVKSSHQRSPYAVNFEDRSQEETERQERCSRGDAWKLAKNIYKLKETEKAIFYSPSKEIDKAAFYFPSEEWVLPAASTKELEERESVGIWSAKKTLTLPNWKT